MTGIVVDGEVTEIVLRSPYDRDIQIGELFVMDDTVFEGRRYLLRVTSIGYGYEAAEGDWAERAAGSIMLMDGREEYRIYHRERRLYKEVRCVPMGIIEENHIRPVKSIPSHFSSARNLEERDYEALRSYMGDIPVGRLRSGGRELDIEAGISGENFPYHMGIFATTGMGKSNLMRVLAASTLRSGRYGMLILDPHGEYYDGPPGESGLRHLNSRRLRVYSSRNISGISQLQVSYTEIFTSDMASIYTMSEAQREALGIFWRAFERNWLYEVHNMRFEELVERFDRVHENTLSVLKRRIDNIFDMGMVTTDPTYSVSNQIISDLEDARVVLVDTSGLGEDEELLISSVLARRVMDHWQNVFLNQRECFESIPPVVITLEEAQRVLQDARKGVFPRIAREGRKFKVGLCAISQQPKLIHEHILSQLNTLFIMGLSDDRDREKLGSASKQDLSPLRNEIKTLNVGEAIITSPFTPFAVPVHIYSFDEYVRNYGEGTGGTRIEHDDGFV